jgi:fatty acid desaturase
MSLAIPFGNKIITRIHDKWYDLTEFEKVHPGGKFPLQLINGRDGTALFELHHPLTESKYLMSMLKKYELNLSPSEEKLYEQTLKIVVSPYDWTPTPFELELKSSVKEFLLKEFNIEKNTRIKGIQTLLYKTKVNLPRLLQIIFMMALFYINIYYYLQGSFIALFLLPITAWVSSVNFWHDATHFGMSTNEWVNIFFMYLINHFSSPLSWFHQHIIGHHVYTNIHRMDPDIAHAPQLMRLHSGVKLRPAHRNQLWNIPLVWLVSVPLGLNFTSDLKGFIKGLYNNIVPYMKLKWYHNVLHVLGRMSYLTTILYPIYLFGFAKGLFFGIFPHAMFSVLFMISSQINHLNETTAHRSSKNLYEHQVLTANTINPNSLGSFILTGGLNLQIEHHLFPGFNHWHLRKIQPIVKEICIKHGIHYYEIPTIWEALKLHFNHVKKMGKQ